jgi:hypothetical protein
MKDNLQGLTVRCSDGDGWIDPVVWTVDTVLEGGGVRLRRKEESEIRFTFADRWALRSIDGGHLIANDGIAIATEREGEASAAFARNSIRLHFPTWFTRCDLSVLNGRIGYHFDSEVTGEWADAMLDITADVLSRALRVIVAPGEAFVPVFRRITNGFASVWAETDEGIHAGSVHVCAAESFAAWLAPHRVVTNIVLEIP